MVIFATLYGLGLGLTAAILWDSFTTKTTTLPNGWKVTNYVRGWVRVGRLVRLAVASLLWPLLWLIAGLVVGYQAARDVLTPYRRRREGP